MHTHIHTQVRAHKHTLTHIGRHMYICTCTHRHTHLHTQILACMCSHKLHTKTLKKSHTKICLISHDQPCVGALFSTDAVNIQTNWPLNALNLCCIRPLYSASWPSWHSVNSTNNASLPKGQSHGHGCCSVANGILLELLRPPDWGTALFKILAMNLLKTKCFVDGLTGTGHWSTRCKPYLSVCIYYVIYYVY